MMKQSQKWKFCVKGFRIMYVNAVQKPICAMFSLLVWSLNCKDID